MCEGSHDAAEAVAVTVALLLWDFFFPLRYVHIELKLQP